MILLTGATGFLGSRLLRQFLERGEDVVILKRASSDMHRIKDLVGRFEAVNLNPQCAEEVFSKFPIREIVHCATHYGRRGIPAWEMVEANLVLPLKLIQHGVDAGVRSFINTDTALDKRVNDYSLSKKQFKEWLNTYADKIVCINVAFQHFFGPGDDKTKFVTKIIEDLLHPVEKIDLTPGHQRRDFIYIDDARDGLLAAFDWGRAAPVGMHSFEVGTGSNISIREFLEQVVELTGNSSTHLEWGALPYRENEVMESKTDTFPLVELGWFPRVSVREGLSLTIEGMKSMRSEPSH